MMRMFIIIYLISMASHGLARLNPNEKILDVADVYNPQIRQAQKATAMMVHEFAVKEFNSSASNYLYRLVSKPLRYQNYCPSFELYQESNAGICSGFLVSPTHLVTAAHCLKRKRSCRGYNWIFNLTAQNGNLPQVIRKDSVYRCRKIIKKRSPLVILKRFLGQKDIAIIELDRPVVGAAPLKFDIDKKIEEGLQVYSLAHPLGTAMKVHPGKVIHQFKNKNFYTDQLVLPGSSGGPVINAQSGKVIGVVSNAFKHLYLNQRKSCIEFKDPSEYEFYRENFHTGITHIRKLKKTLKEVTKKSLK